MLRPSVGILRTVIDLPAVCPELKMFEPPGSFTLSSPTPKRYAVALPLQVNVTVEDVNAVPGVGLVITPYDAAGVGVGVAVGNGVGVGDGDTVGVGLGV